MNKIIFLIIFFTFSLVNSINNPFEIYTDPDEYVSTIELIESKGYPAEEYNVLTSDGYILTVHRIPYGRNSNENQGYRPAVFLQHGLLESSSTWVINFPNQSLGFILADAGYDVWLGNVRGNTYSKKHIRYDTTREEYWDFTWSEMGKYDIPAMVDFVLSFTNQKQLIYVGHSQGTLVLFSQLSSNQQLAGKIKLFVALCPVAFVSHIKTPLKKMADLGTDSKQLFWFKIFGKKEVFPSNYMLQWFAEHNCNKDSINKYLCKNIIFMFSGPSSYFNETRMPVYVTHDPAGTSVKNCIHFAQCYQSGKLQMFDYGSETSNFERYNQTTPLTYELTGIRTPIALYWGGNDWLSSPTDVNLLRPYLNSVVDEYYIDDWSHLDFLWATNTKSVLYDRIINLMKNYN